MQTQFDFSSEMIVENHRNGIRLVRPGRDPVKMHSGTTLGQLLNLAYSIFFFDLNNCVQEVNDECWRTCRFASYSEALGDNIYRLSNNQSHNKLMKANNNNVMRNRKMQVYDEDFGLLDRGPVHTLSFKFPWYGDNNELLGLFGCAINLIDYKPVDVSTKVAMIVNQFCQQQVDVQQMLSPRIMKGNYFSKREMDVVRLVMSGKSMREVALLLGLSQRTVEYYFANIKSKLNVNTKSQFFEKMMSENDEQP